MSYLTDLLSSSPWAPKGADEDYVARISAGGDAPSEDARPISICRVDGWFIFGVLDGMGGAGSKQYPVGIYHFSGAYIAAWGLKAQIERNLVSNNSSLGRLGVDALLKESCKTFYGKIEEEIGTHKTALRSTLIRSFPTTCSIVGVHKEFGAHIWHAGDSRVYSLSIKGLRQHTKDQLRDEQDPLENLREDVPLSNCLDLKNQESISCFKFSPEPDSIVMCMTDGCFGYVKSPFHFEYTLWNTVQKCSTLDDLADKLISLFRSNPDDRSFVLYANSATAIQTLNQVAEHHIKKIETTLLKPLESIQEDRHIGFIKEIWTTYKGNYLAYGQPL